MIYPCNAKKTPLWNKSQVKRVMGKVSNRANQQPTTHRIKWMTDTMKYRSIQCVCHSSGLWSSTITLNTRKRNVVNKVSERNNEIATLVFAPSLSVDLSFSHSRLVQGCNVYSILKDSTFFHAQSCNWQTCPIENITHINYIGWSIAHRKHGKLVAVEQHRQTEENIASGIIQCIANAILVFINLRISLVSSCRIVHNRRQPTLKVSTWILFSIKPSLVQNS